MRVIAGEARGRHLLAPRGNVTRPTADRVKGAIFSMLETLLLRSGDDQADDQADNQTSERDGGVWADKRVLDLFAGSGALGIEALSRGAAWADFVDRDRAACTAIERNLLATRLDARARVHGVAVTAYLRRAESAGGYDIILADPPYADSSVDLTLATLAASPLVAPRTVLMVEHARQVELAERYGELTRVRTRRHGDTMVSIWLATGRWVVWQGADAAVTADDNEEE